MKEHKKEEEAKEKLQNEVKGIHEEIKSPKMEKQERMSIRGKGK